MILMIDNYDSFTHNLVQVIANYDTEVRVVRHDQITLSEIQSLNPGALVISPGPGHPRDAGICIEAIQAFSGKFTILGICLGHQAIVEAFGGEVISAQRLIHGKASLIHHQNISIFKGLHSPLSVGRYHSLIANEANLPDCLNIIASTTENEIMAVQHKDHLTIGLQFHPESILTPEGPYIIKQFLEMRS